MYTSINFKTKKALKEAVASGVRVTVFSPGIGSPPENGREYVEGPQRVAHTWYAVVEITNGVITKVK
jgi:hypothetical protein